MSITVQRDGQRVYLFGNTFPVKDRIAAIGGTFDRERKAWFVGVAKADAAQALADGVESGEVKAVQQDPNTIRLSGKGRYKGRVYFAGAITDDGLRVRLLTLPDQDGKYLDFWALCEMVEQTKAYGGGTGKLKPVTLGSIARFVAEKRREEEGGTGAKCAACNRPGVLVEDMEDGMMKHARCCDIAP